MRKLWNWSSTALVLYGQVQGFDQHYQNMCGFDSIETARKYLYLFELT